MSEGDDATLPDTRGAFTDPVPRVSSTDLGDRYEVGPILGRGGMGEVRLARDLRIDREVAVKLMRSSQRDEVTMGRFFREARVQGVLEHPAVVPVHDLGIDRDGNPYFVMKRLAGTTLHDVIASKDPAVAERWPRRTLLARLADVCLAIEFAHMRGVIHRDLKPANLMLGDFGEAYVLDWGLARISDDGDSFREVASLSGDNNGQTVAGELLGTPGYMSPEQARGELVDARTDVFALGAVLYEILAGFSALPRGMAAIPETLAAPYLRPSDRTTEIPPELDALCVRATLADPKARPTARELAEGLQSYLDGDRDVAQRKQLADAAVAASRAALEAGGDAARATAMREAARALALEPAHQDAQELLARLMFDLPDTIPAEALASADEERGRIRKRMFRKAGFGYLVGVPILLFTFTLPIHHVWPIIYGLTMISIIATMSFVLGRRVMPMSSPWFLAFTAVNCALFTTTGLLFGAFLLMPIFVVGSLSAFLSQPSRHSRWTLVVMHLVPLVTVLTLEMTGVLPRSFHFQDGSLLITPYTIDLTPMTLLVGFGLAFLAQIGSTIDIQSSFRFAQEDAQNRIHAQTWHLKQLAPSATERKPER